MRSPYLLFLSSVVRGRFQKSVRRYLLSNLEDDLVLARKVLEDIWVSDKQRRNSKQTIVINGWFSKNNKGKLRAETLERLNPGFRVRVSRHIRKDLLVHRKAYGYFCSFKIVLTQRPSNREPSEPINLLIGKSVEDFEALSPSSPYAKKSMENLLAKPPKGTLTAVGFIDSVSSYHNLASRILEVLVLGATEELIVLAGTQEGRFICARAAEILRSRGRQEQADKFEFLGNNPDRKYEVFLEVPIRRNFEPMEIDSSSNQQIRMQREGNGIVEAQTTTAVVLSPGKGWLDLKNVDLLSGALVLNDGTLENYEHAADPTWDFVSGLWQIQFGSQSRKDYALVKTSKKQVVALGESILLGGRNDSNYYHFMVEYLPRLLDIPGSISKSVPIVISTSVPKSGKDALQKLTNRKIIEIDTKKTYRVSRLHVSAPIAQVLDTTKVQWDDGVFIDLEALRKFKENCLSLLGVSTCPVRRIYIKRDSNHRNLSNSEQLEKLALRMGFEVIDVNGMTWEDQVRLFSSARVIIGAGGAVMANYMFLPKGAKVISLTSEYLSEFPLPAYMASVAGASFSYITGKPILTRESRRNSQSLMHSGFRIKPSTFKRVLGSISI